MARQDGPGGPRASLESARQRNELVAALSDEVLIIHATPGGQIERIATIVDQWGASQERLTKAGGRIYDQTS